MKKTVLAFCLLLSFQLFSKTNLSLILPEKPIRKEILLNGLWDFTPNQTTEKKQVQVPGTYANVWDGKWGRPYWDVFAYPREWNKGAMYEKQIVVTDSLVNMNLRLHLNGCLQNYTVLFPGQNFETVHDGYTPRDFELGRKLAKGNYPLKIRIEDEVTRLSGGESQKSRGIWDDVCLQALPDVYVEQGVVVKTFVKNKNLVCEVPIKNIGKQSLKVLVKYFITDAKGKVVKEIDGGGVSLKVGETKLLHVNEAWENAHLWFPYDPYLYHFNTVIYNVNGQPIDWQKERFGFREISWEGHKLFINGRELFLRGHGEHYLGDIQGSREYFQTWFAELQKLGVNFMRLHIYPRHKVLYEVADEMGFLLEAEPAFHFLVPKDTLFAMQHLGDMMKGMINHPSIFTWSVSNELRWRGGGEKPWLVAHAKTIDTTRPIFSSDFSEFSIAGDAIGHHYNTETVFKEWEQFGPNKPMIWDELGEVWQPTRPLGNGTAGYEVIAQDYATGIYRDGNDEIKRAYDFIREGHTFGGKLHRINAVSPWDLGCVFFRWQPYNRYKGIAPEYKSLETADVKPRQILPCATPLNIWDPTLPVYEPNPGYYLFDEDIKWVRFPYDSKNFSFFAGEKTVIASPLMIYDDLRLVDEIHCKVESLDGKVLTETIKKQILSPGELVRSINWEFEMPSFNTASSVNIVREFYYKGEKGYRDVREGRIYPKLNDKLLNLSGKTLGVIDAEGSLIKALQAANINFKTVGNKIKVGELSVLLVNGNELPKNVAELEQAGVSIVQFATPIATVSKSSARLLVNGPDWKVLNGIDQKELTYWKVGNSSGSLSKPSEAANYRLLMAGDKDVKTSAFHEIYVGKACHWVTSLRILPSLNSEPAAGWLLRNLIQSAVDYKAEQPARMVGLFGAQDFADWFKSAGAKYELVKTISESSLKTLGVLLLDARTKLLSEREVATLNKFTTAGGKVLVYQINETTLSGIQQLIGNDLILSKPFLDEKANCVKAATSWTLRSTPKKGIEYFDGVVIPQPFEPNYDPMLAGLSNLDLNWGGKQMFDRGVKMKGQSQVALNENFKILVSNWRNDWSVPPFGGEYINEGKDMRQAQWYLRRDPVLVRVSHGAGEFVLCQLNLLGGAEKGLFLTRHLLTNWECSIGSQNNFPIQNNLFDPSAADNQKLRMAVVEKQLAGLKPLIKVPDVLFDMGGGGDATLRRILLLVDNRMMPLAPEISKMMTGFGNISYSGVTVESPQILLSNFENAIGSSKWDVIYFTIAYEGISDLSEAGLKRFDKDIQSIVTKLKATNARLMWGTQPPLPTVHFKELNNLQIEILNNRAKIIMEANSVLVNDTYGFMMSKTPEYVNQDRKELTLMNSDYFKVFSKKLITTIVEALKFFGN
jgi:hypothetical protein